MKKLLIATPLIVSSLFAGAISVDKVGLNLGVAKSTYKQNDTKGAIILGNNPDKTYNSAEVYTTLNPISEFCKENNIKPYFSFTYSKNSELNHKYLLAGLNKEYKASKKVDIYGGLLAGYGKLKWKYNPLNSTIDNDYKATSAIGGLQVGSDYALTEKVSVGINSKYLVHRYKTDLKPSATSTSQIKHNSTYTISLGVSYKF
jgi:hypothetical protein